MSPVEAVAKAIARKFAETTTADGVARCGPVERYVEDHWQDWLGEARAALTALRDCGVTEGMVEAWVIVPPTPDCDPAENCANEFRAMLDAALEGN